MLGLGNNLILNNASKSDGNFPINVVAPVISGTALVGNTLTSTTGTWTSDTGVTGYLYQWTRDGANISGATNSTYTLVSADLNTTILCKVAATDTDGTSAYVNSNSLVVYDSDYKAVLDYATTQGYTLPSVSQRLKQSILLSSLKTAGVWSKLDTFANFATDGSSNFALIDWKRLTQYTAVNSPSFTANEGFTGNGITSYLSSNFNPAIGTNNYVLNNASRYIYTLSTTGVFDGLELNQGNRITTSGTAQRINQGTGTINSAYSYLTGAGMKSIHRTSSTNVELFSNITQASRTSNSVIVESSIQLISRSFTIYSTNKVSMYAMGSSLVSENTDFVNAFDTYLNSL